MAKVISFVSRKGGTGKTTNAINIANVLAEMGRHVVVIETDINYTLSALRKKERRKVAEGKKIPDLVRTEETSVVKMIKTLENDGVTDYIIVDTAAGNATSYCTNRLCVMSDMVLVPSSLSTNDLLVTEQTLNDILPAKKENPDLKIFILPTRIHSLTRTDTILETYRHLNAPILDVFIPNKKTYTHPSTIRPAEGYLDVVSVILKHIEPQQEIPVEAVEPEAMPETQEVHHEVFDDSGLGVHEQLNQEMTPGEELTEAQQEELERRKKEIEKAASVGNHLRVR